MNIQFYLNDEDNTHFITFNMESNPFKLGDIIKLSVDDIEFYDYNTYTLNAQNAMIKKNKEQKEMFHLKEIKLIKENKYIEMKYGIFTIEYHCEISSKPNLI